ncbi:glycosyltransferase family 39 protein [Candidatus Collierbacteria bacterium]|nr:glycosyltransferase family 39 protein [Candidatus Collierbacteria bacterium]
MISKAFIVFSLSLILFFGLRLPALTRIPVFVDEAIYIRWSQIMRHEPSLRFLPLSDGKQPLFMWATMSSLKIFSDPLVAGRMVSVIAGVMSLFGIAFLTFVLTQNFFLSSLSSLIYALLPFSVFFDRMALVDSLLSAFGLWSLGLGALLIRKTRLDLALLLGFAIGFGLITKSPAIFFYLWQPILFLALFDFHAPRLRSRLAKLLIFWLITFILSQAIYNILRLGANFHLVGSRNQDYLFSIREVLAHPANPLIGNSKTTVLWLWYLFTPPLFLCLLASFFSRFRKISFWILFLSLSALTAQAFIAKVYTSRYILFAAMPLIFPITLGLHELGHHLKKLWLAIPIILLWPLILSGVLIASPEKANLPFDMRSGYLEDWTAGWGQKEVATYLIDRASRGEKSVVITDGFFGTLPDGLQIYTAKYPNITVIGGSPSITTLPTSLTDSLKDKANTVYLVANASRVNLSAEDSSRLTLISRFEKPSRLDGTHESLLFFQLLR